MPCSAKFNRQVYMLTDEDQKRLGKFIKSEVLNEYGDWRTIRVDYENGYCTYDCDIRKSKTKNHKWEMYGHERKD